MYTVVYTYRFWSMWLWVNNKKTSDLNQYIYTNPTSGLSADTDSNTVTGKFMQTYIWFEPCGSVVIALIILGVQCNK